MNENRFSVFSHPRGVSEIKNLFSFTPGVSENGEGANENVTPDYVVNLNVWGFQVNVRSLKF